MVYDNSDETELQEMDEDIRLWTRIYREDGRWKMEVAMISITMNSTAKWIECRSTRKVGIIHRRPGVQEMDTYVHTLDR